MGSARLPRSMPWTPQLPGLCDLRREGSQRPPEHERHVERHAQAVAHHQQHPDLSEHIYLYQLQIVWQQQVQLLSQSTLSMLLQLLLHQLLQHPHLRPLLSSPNQSSRACHPQSPLPLSMGTNAERRSWLECKADSQSQTWTPNLDPAVKTPDLSLSIMTNRG